MRAAVFDHYGRTDVVRIAELPRPVPGPGEVLVRVRAAALNPKDIMVIRGKFKAATGRRFPKQLGYDWSGEVVAVGRDCAHVPLGQRRFGMIQSWRAGAIAEFAAVRVDESAAAPDSLPPGDAAALPLASLTALQALRDDAGLRAGQRLLVNGGSGGVGTYAIQIGKLLGAEVTTLSSAANLELCRSLGAESALDYAVDDPWSDAAGYDVIFDVFGNHSFAQARTALTATGTYVQTIPSPRIVADAAVSRFRGGQRARLVVVKSKASDLERIASWVDAGELRPVIDRSVPLDDVADALAHLGTRRARGKILIELG